MENFEKYLRENRDELDRMEEFEHDKMWKGVFKKIPNHESPGINHPSRFQWKWMAIAASVVALIGWALFIFQAEPEPQFFMADFSPELAERESELQKLISQKEIEIGLDTLNPETFAEVFAELAELESNAELTRQDLAAGLIKERTLETLIRQYELKIRILENLSREIDKNKYHDELEKEI